MFVAPPLVNITQIADAADADPDESNSGKQKKKRKPTGRVYTKQERVGALLVSLYTYLSPCVLRSFTHKPLHAITSDCGCCCICLASCHVCLQVHRVHSLCLLSHALLHDQAAADPELQVCVWEGGCACACVGRGGAKA